MTTISPDVSPGFGAWLAVNSQRVIRYGGLAFVAAAGFSGAFTHMHDWTAHALPSTPDWLCWANAVISEILPMTSFLSWRDRSEQGRSTGLPLAIFFGSSTVSLTAQFTAAGATIPGAAYFLAALPMLAVLVLSKLVFSDLDYARKARVAAEQAAELNRRRAEQAAEQARRTAELRAEQAAEQARQQAVEAARQAAEQEERRAAQAAELAERQAAQAAEQAARLAEIEQAAITAREQLAVDERRAEREARLAIEREAARIKAAGEADAARLRAEAEAEARRVEAEAAAARLAAETVRLETETKIREQAVSRLTGRHRPVGEGSGPAASPASPIDLDEARASRRSREETEALVGMTLSAMPAGAKRADAVKAVAAQLGASERYARKWVPEDWSAGGSVDGSGEQAG
jgi:hypothetical protein